MQIDRVGPILLFDIWNNHLDNPLYYTGGWGECQDQQGTVLNLALLTFLTPYTCNLLTQELLQLESSYGLACATSEQFFHPVTMFDFV